MEATLNCAADGPDIKPGDSACSVAERGDITLPVLVKPSYRTRNANGVKLFAKAMRRG